METKEKYVSIKLEVGKALHLAHKAINEGIEHINVAAFKNDKKIDETDQRPHYKSHNCAVWIQEKKEKPTP